MPHTAMILSDVYSIYFNQRMQHKASVLHFLAFIEVQVWLRSCVHVITRNSMHRLNPPRQNNDAICSYPQVRKILPYDETNVADKMRVGHLQWVFPMPKWVLRVL